MWSHSYLDWSVPMTFIFHASYKNFCPLLRLRIYQDWWLVVRFFYFHLHTIFCNFTRYYQHSTFKWDLLWHFFEVICYFLLVQYGPLFFLKVGVHFAPPKLKWWNPWIFCLPLPSIVILLLQDWRGPGEHLREAEGDGPDAGGTPQDRSQDPHLLAGQSREIGTP